MCKSTQRSILNQVGLVSSKEVSTPELAFAF